MSAGHVIVRDAPQMTRIGRLFLTLPLYQALTKTSEGLAYAEQVYAKARAGYHPLTQQAGWRSSLRRAGSTSRLFVMRHRSNKYVD